MGYQCISVDLKQHALWLLDNGYLAHEVQEILNVSHSSINHWTHNLDEYGHVVTLQGHLSDYDTLRAT